MVIGQGAAGLTAALALARAGVEVVSLSKVTPGTATCTLYAGGGFTLGIGGLSPEQHREMTFATGRRINVPELLATFAGEAPTIVDFLSGAGVPFRTGNGGLGVAPTEGLPLLGGKSLTDGLAAACRAAGVSFRPNTAAMRIITGDRGVSGVDCLDLDSGTGFTLPAESVVLATGGAGALFPRTDNPARISGDGYRLALDAGCHLLDMEFVQFYPIGIDIPGGATWFMDLGTIDLARVTGPDGSEFLKEMLAREGISSGREANLLARDKCTVAIALANARGEVLLHLEDIPPEVWQSNHHLSAIARMFPKSRPAGSEPVPLHPVEHYFPGGVAIGTEGETEIPGLFACGEVTGGVDGANRVGGNALTNCILFGSRAGNAAARHAHGDSVAPLRLAPLTAAPVGTPATAAPALPAALPVPLPAAWTADDWLARWRRNVDAADAVPAGELRRELRQVAADCLLPVRTAAQLAAGLARLGELADRLLRQKIEQRRDLLLATENLGLWYSAAAVAAAAALRTESRGAHYRADYPHEDTTWERHILLHRDGAGLVRETSATTGIFA